jgi:hypothetical protein
VECDGVVELNGCSDGRCSSSVSDVSCIDGNCIVWEMVDDFEWDVVENVWSGFGAGFKAVLVSSEK